MHPNDFPRIQRRRFDIEALQFEALSLFTPMVRTAVHRPAPASGLKGGKGPIADR